MLPEKREWKGFVMMMVVLGHLLFPGGELQAAVAPNDQTGECGPYYLWYQASPDGYPPLLDYLDLCGITFDISDVVNDFDFVYFTDTEKTQRAALDKNQDGVSDLYFEGRTQNLLKWKPQNGCRRVNLRQCQDGIGFREDCAYAMISIQPKRGFRDGSARISIGINAKCPPNGADCSRSYEFVHRYANCFEQTLPEFVIQKKVDREFADTSFKKEEAFEFTVSIRNTGAGETNDTFLTEVSSVGTEGGRLRLSKFNLTCPGNSTCDLIDAKSGTFVMTLADIPINDVAKLSYTLKIYNNEIQDEKVSYFTTTTTLSSDFEGEKLVAPSVKAVVGVVGIGEESVSPEPERRPERPYER